MAKNLMVYLLYLCLEYMLIILYPVSNTKFVINIYISVGKNYLTSPRRYFCLLKIVVHVQLAAQVGNVLFKSLFTEINDDAYTAF